VNAAGEVSAAWLRRGVGTAALSGGRAEPEDGATAFGVRESDLEDGQKRSILARLGSPTADA
jgi:hypothetical protein